MMPLSILHTVNEYGYVMPWKEFRHSEPITNFVWANLIGQSREQNKVNIDRELVINADEVIRMIKSGELELELFELSVLALTFARVIVKQEYFLLVAALIEQFIAKYPAANRTS